MMKRYISFLLIVLCSLCVRADIEQYKYVFSEKFFSLKGKNNGNSKTLTLLDAHKTPLKCVVQYTPNLYFDADYQGLCIGDRQKSGAIRINIPISWNWNTSVSIKRVRLWTMGDPRGYTCDVLWNGSPMTVAGNNYYDLPMMLYSYEDISPVTFDVPTGKRTKKDYITIEVSSANKHRSAFLCALEVEVDKPHVEVVEEEVVSTTVVPVKDEEQPEVMPEHPVTVTFKVTDDGTVLGNTDFKRKVCHVEKGGTYTLPFAERERYYLREWTTPDGTLFDPGEVLQIDNDMTFEALWDTATYTLSIDGEMQQYISELYVNGKLQSLSRNGNNNDFHLRYKDVVRVAYTSTHSNDKVLIGNLWLSNNETWSKHDVSLQGFSFDMPDADVVLDFSTFTANEIGAFRKMYTDGIIKSNSPVTLDLRGKQVTFLDNDGLYLRDATGGIFVSGTISTADGLSIGKRFTGGTLMGTVMPYNTKSLQIANSTFNNVSTMSGTIDTIPLLVEEIRYDFDTYEGAIVRISGKISKWRLTSDGVAKNGLLISNRFKIGTDVLPSPNPLEDYSVTGLVAPTKKGSYAIVPSRQEDVVCTQPTPLPTLSDDEEPVSSFTITPAPGTTVTYMMNGDDDWHDAQTITSATEIHITQDTAIFYYSTMPLHQKSEVTGTYYYYKAPLSYTVTLHNLNEKRTLSVSAEETVLSKIKTTLFDANFLGWSTDKANPNYIDADYKPTGNMHLYAMYEDWENYYVENANSRDKTPPLAKKKK